MTLSSMTAFSREALEAEWGSLAWEVRSVNHRFLEAYVRLPEQFRQLDVDVRTLMKKMIKRGKVDASLQFVPSPDFDEVISLNESALTQLMQMTNHVREKFPNVQTNPLEVLRWNGVLQKQSADIEVVEQAAMALLEKSLADLASVRQREGAGLLEFLQEAVGQMQVEMEKIKVRLPQVLAHERARVLERLSELSVSVDHDRLEQEMVWLAQKADIAEELQRLTVHVQEVRRVIQAGGVVGRRLDFLMQELNREVNTIASKSLDVETTQSAVEMKVLIEQMREQVQNIE